MKIIKTISISFLIFVFAGFILCGTVAAAEYEYDIADGNILVKKGADVNTLNVTQLSSAEIPISSQIKIYSSHPNTPVDSFITVDGTGLEGQEMNILIKDLHIDGASSGVSAFKLAGNATVNLTIEGLNTLLGGTNMTTKAGQAGLNNPAGCRLTITENIGGGELIAIGGVGGLIDAYYAGGSGSGIGGNGGVGKSPDSGLPGENSGSLILNSGVITAVGGNGGGAAKIGGGGGSGIGGGSAGSGGASSIGRGGSSSGSIQINGGTVVAIGGNSSAKSLYSYNVSGGGGSGIGGGGGSVGSEFVFATGGKGGDNLGNIEITGGFVTVIGGGSSGHSGGSGSGIGGGGSGGYFSGTSMDAGNGGSNSGSITISGGVVTVSGGVSGVKSSGIGGGGSGISSSSGMNGEGGSNSGDILINDSSVDLIVKSGGIGGGYSRDLNTYGNGGTAVIADGNVLILGDHIGNAEFKDSAAGNAVYPITFYIRNFEDECLVGAVSESGTYKAHSRESAVSAGRLTAAEDADDLSSDGTVTLWLPESEGVGTKFKYSMTGYSSVNETFDVNMTAAVHAGTIETVVLGESGPGSGGNSGSGTGSAVVIFPAKSSQLIENNTSEPEPESSISDGYNIDSERLITLFFPFGIGLFVFSRRLSKKEDE